jgi:hypothetical protein
VVADPGEGGPLEQIAAHELTHLIMGVMRGAPGSPLLGEGLAVYTSGAYALRPLDAWVGELAASPLPLGELWQGFFRLPEPRSYPAAGLFVRSAIGVVGIERFLQELYCAAPSEWSAACTRAGTTPELIEAAYRASFSPR